MMASERERWLGHFELQLHVKNRPNEGLELADALKIINDADIIGSVEIIETDDRWILHLADMTTIDDKVVLLFLGIDKQRAAAIYGNIKTLSLRAIQKAQDEGVAVSAHLAVSLKANPKTGCHNAILEEIEGLSRSKLVPYLRRLLNERVNFYRTKEDGSDEQVESHLSSIVTLDKPIQIQLNEAKLIAVQAIKKSSEKTIDQTSEFFEKRKFIEYRPTRPSSGDLARGIVNKILKLVNKAEYPEIRIRVEEDEGRERTVSVNRSTQADPLASAFQLRTLISDIQPPLPQASKKVVVHFANKMVKVLK